MVSISKTSMVRVFFIPIDYAATSDEK